MKITIDLEAVSTKKRDFLLTLLFDERIPYSEELEEKRDDAVAEFERKEWKWNEAGEESRKEEWDEETIIAHNRELAEAEARIEAGQLTTQEELEEEIKNW